MAALYDLREELTALLRQGLPDAAVTGEYPGEGRRYPQTVPAVAVGIAEAALQKLDYLGEQDAGEQSGRRWETRFQLELSAPRRSGAGELYRLFDQVSGLLLTYGSRYGLQEVDCGRAEYIRERVGIIAAADDEAALALAAAVNCERVMLTAGSGVYQDCDSPLCLAAAVAGKLLSRSAPDESLSASVLEGLSAVSPARSEAEIETLLRGGVMPAEWVGGQAECIRGVTTRTKNGSAPDSTWRDITTLLTVDHIMQAVRQMLTEKLRGVRSSQQSLESVASQVTVLLQQKEEEGLLEDWSDPVVYTRPGDASVCVVELSFAVARVVSRITVTASITL